MFNEFDLVRFLVHTVASNFFHNRQFGANPGANGGCMVNDRIRESVGAYTAHVRKYADITGWDIGHQPTSAEKAERRAAIEAICDEMDALAQKPDSRFSDFAALRRMYDFFPPTPPDLLRAVTEAFLSVGR